jgi:hypothetical protein
MVSTAHGLLSAIQAAWERARQLVQRQFITRNRRLAFVLALAVIAIGAAAVRVSVSWFSPGVMILPILAGGMLLWPRALRILFGLTAVMLAYDALEDRAGPGIIATIVVTAGLADALARTRKKLGLQGLRGNQMLVELRDRITAASRLPGLPPGWHGASLLKAAGGSSFGGDFVVSACDGKTLELALVDVSGKGVDAGTRALILSGAFGGLLGSVPRQEFLSACNAYLLRTAASDGFVTAVHLALDLVTGDYMIGSAGHPPAAHFEAGSGTWRIVEARGIILGVAADLRGAPAHGVLRAGDALLLYTDGLVEAAGTDIDTGIGRLLGEADRMVTAGFGGTALARLADAMGNGRQAPDDRALVLIWRT